MIFILIIGLLFLISSMSIYMLGFNLTKENLQTNLYQSLILQEQNISTNQDYFWEAKTDYTKCLGKNIGMSDCQYRNLYGQIPPNTKIDLGYYPNINGSGLNLWLTGMNNININLLVNDFENLYQYHIDSSHLDSQGQYFIKQNFTNKNINIKIKNNTDNWNQYMLSLSGINTLIDSQNTYNKTGYITNQVYQNYYIRNNSALDTPINIKDIFIKPPLSPFELKGNYLCDHKKIDNLELTWSWTGSQLDFANQVFFDIAKRDGDQNSNATLYTGHSALNNCKNNNCEENNYQINCNQSSCDINGINDISNLIDLGNYTTYYFQIQKYRCPLGITDCQNNNKIQAYSGSNEIELNIKCP